MTEKNLTRSLSPHVCLAEDMVCFARYAFWGPLLNPDSRRWMNLNPSRLVTLYVRACCSRLYLVRRIWYDRGLSAVTRFPKFRGLLLSHRLIFTTGSSLFLRLTWTD